ncbi:MAG TPA: DUF1214 domain-containing protein [Acidimicrobiales bacterium]|nr:DUF1214 domain-containing protein [Acidimicrobiales bacterium]
MAGAGGLGEDAAMAWFPAAVGAAYRKGTTGADALMSGAAFDDLVAGLRRAAELVRSAPAADTEVDRAAGYRHLLVLLGLAVDEALRAGDPYDPVISPANVDAVLTWGMDCPDAAYSGTPVRGDTCYRIRGRRGSARYLGFQVMAGIETTANVVADELDIGPDGTFELTLGGEAVAGNWMPLADRATSLVVRQFFYDWGTEVPAALEIECVGRRPEPVAPEPLSAAGVGRQLGAVGAFLEASIRFWLDIEEAGRAQGLNVFRPPAALTAMGAAAENVSVWGSWDLGDDEALVVEVTPPEAVYWSVSLGNYWWETIDYARRQSSLNGHQAVLDADGVFRAVVAGRDPGVANWLDTAGNHRGPAIFRWLRAAGAPVPATRVVPVADVVDVLPPGTAIVSPEERSAVLARRRAGVGRRFPR